MVLGKLPVPGRPTISITVGQGLIYPFSPLSPSLWETARYRLKYCLKGALNPKQPNNQPTEEIIAEHQIGFGAGRSTTEQIFNLRILCEKYHQHQQNLYHIFIDLKKPLTEYGMQPYGPACGSMI